MFGVNFYSLTHPILAKNKNKILLSFLLFFFFRMHVNNRKKYPQRRNFQENPNILELGGRFFSRNTKRS